MEKAGPLLDLFMEKLILAAGRSIPTLGRQKNAVDVNSEGRETKFMDVDRMINEGLGGGMVTINNGLIGDTTTDTLDQRESIYEDDGSV